MDEQENGLFAETAAPAHGKGAARPPEARHVPITQSGSSFLFAVPIAIFFIVATGILFLQGVRMIRADLVDGLVPALEVAVTDAGFAPSLEGYAVHVGDLIRFVNTRQSVEQLRSDERTIAGKLLLESPELAPGAAYDFTVQGVEPGTTMTVRSGFSPATVGTLTISAAEKAPESPRAPAPSPMAELSVPVPETSSVPPGTAEPTVEVPEVSVSPASPVPTVPSTVTPPIVQSPPVPFSPPAPAPVTVPTPPVVPPTPLAPLPPVASPWPALLRVNRFAVGSGLVPALAPTSQLPIHAVARAREQMQQSGRTPRPPRQPQTGPALGLILTLSLCGVPLLSWRRGRKS